MKRQISLFLVLAMLLALLPVHGYAAGTLKYGMNGENVKKLYSSDNKLNGFILMGEKIERAGIYTALIRERTDLTTVDWELLKQAPQLAAFAKEKRYEILSKGA